MTRQFTASTAGEADFASDCNTMVNEVIDLLAPNVRGMLRILHMPDVTDHDMRELIFRLGQTSKCE